MAALYIYVFDHEFGILDVRHQCMSVAEISQIISASEDTATVLHE